MSAYYNEIDPFAAQWLRNLIAAGHVAPGDVDERSIIDVKLEDLKGYIQCHFFAGIGAWSYALRLAGWPDERPVWTGSCPCQPFSAAGKQKGFADDRHLWPAWFRLIKERRPEIVLGEQVEAAIRHGWLDAVQSDMEGEGYAFGAVGLPAAGVGAPHIRQRLWFVGMADPGKQSRKRDAGSVPCSQDKISTARIQNGGVSIGHPDGRAIGELADAQCGAAKRHRRELGTSAREMQSAARQQRIRDDLRDGDDIDGVADSNDARPQGRGERRDGTGKRSSGESGLGLQEWASSTNGFWKTADWLFCRDEKWRPVEPGTFPVVDGAAARVGRLRAYGNAIVPQVAQAFIEAAMGVRL